MQDIIEKLRKIRYQQDFLLRKKEELNLSSLSKAEEIESLKKELILNIETKDLYNKSVELIYQNSLGKLQDSINSALQYIFYDKNFQIVFDLGTSRSKTLKLYLLDDGKKSSLKSGNGAGVRSIVSFIFLIYYLLAKKSYPILFLDESYYQISTEYVERFFEFMNKIIEEKKFTIVIITHDMRFIDFADYRYHIIDGKIISNS